MVVGAFFFVKNEEKIERGKKERKRKRTFVVFLGGHL